MPGSNAGLFGAMGCGIASICSTDGDGVLEISKMVEVAQEKRESFLVDGSTVPFAFNYF